MMVGRAPLRGEPTDKCRMSIDLLKPASNLIDLGSQLGNGKSNMKVICGFIDPALSCLLTARPA
jgi:hypothetical protein